MKKAASSGTASSFQALPLGRVSSKEYARSIKVETRKLVRETPLPKRPPAEK